jgi:hypothetical protein
MAMNELLLEQAELVVNPVTECGIIQCAQRIEETRREPPQTAVAQSHVHFGFADRVEIDAQG